MYLRISQILALMLVIPCSLAHSSAFKRNSHSSVFKRNSNAITNRSTLYAKDTELANENGKKYVFMHHIVGNTYTYTTADWIDDIQKIQGRGVDALALNIGRSDWQQTQVANAYAAAKSLGTGFKLFLSFDFTEMDCVLSDFVSRVNKYANHPNQFKVNGKPMISSYSGDCLGNSGWESLKAQTNGYLMPFIWGLEGIFSQWPSLDSWCCWGCAWSQGNYDKNTNDDLYYLGQLGTRYAATVAAWMYTHFSYKNWYLRGDDWLINSRWEQIISMRNDLTFVEMLTWNDYGESDYFGPIKGTKPDGTTWVDNFPHIAWHDMSEYYITAFKTGSYPPITKDIIYFWARSHPAAATASGDHLPKPKGYDWTEDSMWAVVFATSPATVILQCGSSSSTFVVSAGVKKLKIPLSPGKMTVKMIKDGKTIINETPQDYLYVANPVLYNYNAWVGSATAPGSVIAASSPVIAAPSSVITAPGSVLATSNSVIAVPSSVIAAPGSVLATLNLVIAAPSSVIAAPGSVLATSNSVIAAPSSVIAASGVVTPTPTPSPSKSSKSSKCRKKA